MLTRPRIEGVPLCSPKWRAIYRHGDCRPVNPDGLFANAPIFFERCGCTDPHSSPTGGSILHSNHRDRGGRSVAIREGGRRDDRTRQLWGPLERSVLVGEGIDIGCGDDPVSPNVVQFDRAQGDANDILRYVQREFDFVYSSHCLEHMWILGSRSLTTGGCCVMPTRSGAERRPLLAVPSQSSRRRESRAVRSGSEAAETGCPLNPGNSTLSRRGARWRSSVHRQTAAMGCGREPDVNPPRPREN